MKISDTAYFSVQGWMVTKLNLRGAERDAYAIIYGYSQDNESDYHGSLEYMSQLTGYSKNALCTALKTLTDKGLILKEEKVVNGIKYCRYRTSSLDGNNPSSLDSIQVTCMDNAEKPENTIQARWMNNKQVDKKEINNKKENKEYSQTFRFGNQSHSVIQTANKEVETFKDLYNEHCYNLPTASKLTDERIKAINKLIKKYSVDDIIKVFDIANESDFLRGKNDRGWKANIDFILREDKFVSILEGKYNGKASSGKNVARDIEHLDPDKMKHATLDQKRQFKEDIANGTAEKY